MNIEIANRLVELRKKYGYSQEELAAKLGISRQAVSKWERAESSPDTDNLICLAKLYNCSLDDLLKTDESIEDIAFDKKEETKKKKSYVNIGKDGIHVLDDDEEVHIDLNGIHIKDGEEEFHLGSKCYDFKTTTCGDNYISLKKKLNFWKFKILSSLSIVIVIVYILLGVILDAWHPGWLLFTLIPLFDSLVTSIIYKSWHKFCFPLLIADIYLIVGFFCNLWHPTWAIFLSIPLYYLLTPESEYHIITKNIDGVNIKDFVKKD